MRVLGSWACRWHGDGVAGLDTGRRGRECEGVAARRGNRRGYVLDMAVMLLEGDVEARREGGVRFVPDSGSPFGDECLAGDAKPPPASKLPDETVLL